MGWRLKVRTSSILYVALDGRVYGKLGIGVPRLAGRRATREFGRPCALAGRHWSKQRPTAAVLLLCRQVYPYPASIISGVI